MQILQIITPVTGIVMNRPEALILDMDGVLVDTEPIHIESFRKYISGLNIAADEQFLADLVGHSVESNIVDVNNTYLAHAPVPLAEGVKLREKLYLDLLKASNIGPMPGLEVLLKACLERNIQLGLATSSVMEQVQVIFDKLTTKSVFGIDYHNLFAVIVSGDDVKEKKPAPEVYQKAVSALGLMPSNCWAIEDSAAGIESARAAGLKCLVLKNQYIKKAAMTNADAVIDSLFEAAENIKKYA